MKVFKLWRLPRAEVVYRSCGEALTSLPADFTCYPQVDGLTISLGTTLERSGGYEDFEAPPIYKSVEGGQDFKAGGMVIIERYFVAQDDTSLTPFRMKVRRPSDYLPISGTYIHNLQSIIHDACGKTVQIYDPVVHIESFITGESPNIDDDVQLVTDGLSHAQGLARMEGHLRSGILACTMRQQNLENAIKFLTPNITPPIGDILTRRYFQGSIPFKDLNGLAAHPIWLGDTAKPLRLDFPEVTIYNPVAAYPVAEILDTMMLTDLELVFNIENLSSVMLASTQATDRYIAYMRSEANDRLRIEGLANTISLAGHALWSSENPDEVSPFLKSVDVILEKTHNDEFTISYYTPYGEKTPFLVIYVDMPLLALSGPSLQID